MHYCTFSVFLIPPVTRWESLGAVGTVPSLATAGIFSSLGFGFVVSRTEGRFFFPGTAQSTPE